VTKVSPLFGRAHNFQTWWSTSGHGPRSGSQNTGCEHVPAHFCHFHVSNWSMELLFGGTPKPFCQLSGFMFEPETPFRSSSHAILSFFKFQVGAGNNFSEQLPRHSPIFSGFRFEPETTFRSSSHAIRPFFRFQV